MWTEKYNLPFYHRVWEGEDSPDSEFTQVVARDWRRSQCQSILKEIQQDKSLRGLSQSIGGDYWIATAHHRDDQMESLILRLFRGAHLTNLQLVIP